MKKTAKRSPLLKPLQLPTEIPLAQFGDRHGGIALFRYWTGHGANDGIVLRPVPGLPPVLTYRQAALLSGALQALLADERRFREDDIEKASDSPVFLHGALNDDGLVVGTTCARCHKSVSVTLEYHELYDVGTNGPGATLAIPPGWESRNQGDFYPTTINCPACSAMLTPAITSEAARESLVAALAKGLLPSGQIERWRRARLRKATKLAATRKRPRKRTK
jgi:hypothetical protein